MPIRTCIGCGRKDQKRQLCRIVLDKTNRTVRPDPGAALPGRGAWLHTEPGCLERGLEARRLARAFRARVEVSPELSGTVLKATRSVAM